MDAINVFGEVLTQDDHNVSVNTTVPPNMNFIHKESDDFPLRPNEVGHDRVHWILQCTPPPRCA